MEPYAKWIDRLNQAVAYINDLKADFETECARHRRHRAETVIGLKLLGNAPVIPDERQ